MIPGVSTVPIPGLIAHHVEPAKDVHRAIPESGRYRVLQRRADFGRLLAVQQPSGAKTVDGWHHRPVQMVVMTISAR